MVLEMVHEKLFLSSDLCSSRPTYAMFRGKTFQRQQITLQFTMYHCFLSVSWTLKELPHRVVTEI